jgi:type I restriction enzyme M protein
VLLGKSGTVGKAGVVRDGAVGGVASGTVFVISPNKSKLDPHYLTAYLMSAYCQDWLKSQSGGSVISGLRKKLVEELWIPSRRCSFRSA